MMKVADTGTVPTLLLVLPIPTCNILAMQLPGTLPAEFTSSFGVVRVLCSSARSAPPLSAEKTTRSQVTLPLDWTGHDGSGSRSSLPPPFHTVMCWVSIAICQEKGLCFLSLQEVRSQVCSVRWCRRQDFPILSVCAWGLHSFSVHWFVVGKGRVCGMGPVVTQITVQCAAQVHLSICFPSHPQSVLQACGELNGAQFLWCKSKSALRGCAIQMVFTVLRAPVCRSGSMQDGCMEIPCGKFDIMSLRRTPFCCLFSPWSVLRYLSTEQVTASYWKGTGGGCHFSFRLLCLLFRLLASL